MAKKRKNRQAPQNNQPTQGNNPNFVPATKVVDLQAQQKRIQNRIDKKGGEAPVLQKRLDSVNDSMLQARKTKLENKIAQNAARGDQSPVLQDRLDNINSELEKKKETPEGAPTEENTTSNGDTGANTGNDTSPANTPTTDEGPTPDQLAEYEAKKARVMETLFPKAPDPSNYQGQYQRYVDSIKNYQESPLYQLQKQEGIKDLERMAAARGLTASGAELAGAGKFVNELGARHADRVDNLAQNELRRLDDLYRFDSQAAQNAATQNANMLYTIMNFDTNRGDALQQNDFENKMRVVDTYLNQNPIQYGANAANTAGQLAAQQGQVIGGTLDSIYANPSAYAGGSGGSGTPAPQFIPPQPTAPNYGMSNLAGIIGGNSQTQDRNKSIVDFVSSWF